MTADEFTRRAALTKMHGRALDAARLVLVEGLSRYAAAERLGIDVAAVSRAAKKISELKICQCCGNVITDRIKI
jgi:predicted DNA-binding protein (UPF0251 family)